jgi:ADP-dependent NAD(P)H-hydrate dehydratase / NAD(P)H-hydrate epimerase
MKILPVKLIREADQYTIEHEPITDIDLMERAAHGCFEWIYREIPVTTPVRVIAGTGNNGGDGLAIARMLSEKDYKVFLYLTGDPEKLSPSAKINFDRLPDAIPVSLLGEDKPEPSFEEKDVIIDAIFGSGLARPVSGFYAKLISWINDAGCMVVSIDVPSGLFVDKTVFDVTDPVVVKAHYTLTFAPPKLAFFFPENARFTGIWELIDIGLSPTFIESVSVKNFMITKATVKPLLKERKKYDHKGTFGHALLISGSRGKMGAAVLAAGGCLRSGAGLVTVHIPASGINILQTAIPEAMLSIDEHETCFGEVPTLDRFNAIGIGPGLGTNPLSQTAMKVLIQQGIPLVIDADALNILAENPTWLSFLPKGSILTPHPGEFERLAGKSANDFEQNQRQRELSIKYGCYIILKRANTAITTPAGNCFFNTTGNPGMGTGGSGDVLTGIITGLMAQHYPPLEACLTGVYLHGLAGDLAARASGEEALIAGDLIKELGNAYKTIHGEF